MTIKYVKVDDVRSHPANPKAHDLDALVASISRFGFAEPVVVDQRTGLNVSGHGRVAAIKRMRRKKLPPPDGVTRDWEVPVYAAWASRDDREAEAALIALNRITETGGWHDEPLRTLMERLDAIDGGLDGTGFDVDDLDDLRAKLGAAEARNDQTHKQTKNDRRLKQVDIYYTAGPVGTDRSEVGSPFVAPWLLGHCCLAVRSGWSYGTRSSDGACGGCATWKHHAPGFIDNDFRNYNHDRHLEVVAHWKPKYATVRDVMTKQQCSKAEIDYVPVEQIVEWADELAEHAANVIVIPKSRRYLHAIPERFTLGYSVPTSYGGTPLPIDAFAGRPIHLLGGSPARQLQYFHARPDDVVSMDNNTILLTCQYGSSYGADGDTVNLDHFGITQGTVSNPMWVALAISLGTIARWYQREPEAADVAVASNERD